MVLKGARRGPLRYLRRCLYGLSGRRSSFVKAVCCVLLFLLVMTAMEIIGTTLLMGSVREIVDDSSQLKLPTIHPLWTSEEARIRQSLTIKYRPKQVKFHGTPRSRKGFLTIGIPTINRKDKGSWYLRHTVSSIINKMAAEDRERVTILIYIADYNEVYRSQETAYFRTHYPKELASGLILLVLADPSNYPPLLGIQRNYNDSEERVKWRSKQVVDYAFMFHYGQNLSHYYMQLEDDVIAAKDYVRKIKDFIEEQKEPWVTLQFSLLGFIGKLYRSTDLPLLYDFLMLFYDQMPVDWLYEHFAKVMARPEMPLRRPTLFQHIGRKSSFQHKDEVKLFDGYFEDDLKQKTKGDNPPGTCCTNINQHLDKKPAEAYNRTWPFEFFWGKDIKNGSHFTLIFESPQELSEVEVVSGHSFRKDDIVKHGVLELGYMDQQRIPKNCTCDYFQSVSTFQSGRSVVTTNNTKIINPVSCVRIRFTKEQTNWVIIFNIIVRTAKQISTAFIA